MGKLSQIAIYMALLFAMAPLLGFLQARVFEGKAPHGFDPSPARRMSYRVGGIDRWQK